MLNFLKSLLKKSINLFSSFVRLKIFFEKALKRTTIKINKPKGDVYLLKLNKLPNINKNSDNKSNP